MSGPGVSSANGTCPTLAATRGHSPTMSTPGRANWACPPRSPSQGRACPASGAEMRDRRGYVTGAGAPLPIWEDVPVTSPAPGPLRRPRGRRHMALGALVLPVVIGMAACSTPAPTVSASSAGSAGAVSEAPAPVGKASAVPTQEVSGASPSGSAAPSAVSGAVAAALQALVASTPQPSREQVRESLSAAGFAPAAVEVSASRTPTGLAADAVEVGVLGEGECVMAQIRSGTVESSVLPVLPKGRCFVGSIQR